MLLLLTTPLGVLAQNTPGSLSLGNFTVASKFMVDTGMLFYDKLDLQGHIIERIEKFYPIPPIGECNSTTFGEFQ